ncbi:hypothetical protein JTE90_013744 [Oedothorax gibbosus]|uniref:rRNA methyltransferase 2, mitochondrial n=1 Tax=Oedothorax gibbosus TaxID=931172 RepID=A0AAV6V0Y8_9ARAC|nr:hypothetical protein JTE90_013744 [Oedothorax gibbosus]
MNLQSHTKNLIKSIFFKSNNAIQRRYISKSIALCKTIPDNAKSKSSHEWLQRQINDVYVKKSRYHGYRCRSAYKLLEIDEKYNILKTGYSVVDCGAAPGSWTQVVVNKLKLDRPLKDGSAHPNVAVSVDLQRMEPIKGAFILSESDFTSSLTQEEIWKILPGGKANVVLSDMAPKATGTYELDCSSIINLVYNALRFATVTLKKDGVFLCKVWDSRDVEMFVKTLDSLFTSVKRVKPKASRMDSAELFLLARGYKCNKFIK